MKRRVALFARFVIMVGCAVQAVTTLFYIAPLPVLESMSSFGVFSMKRLQTALLFPRFNSLVFDKYIIFFGLRCLLTGFLILKSIFLPGVLRVLLAISASGWLIHLWPPLVNIEESLLQLWLIVMPSMLYDGTIRVSGSSSEVN
ncbi:MAG: DUF4386 family protein [Acidobacteria bacterium]|nr:DUF4386 family protein [Acidobacteriota bacterium]